MIAGELGVRVGVETATVDLFAEGPRAHRFLASPNNFWSQASLKYLYNKKKQFRTLVSHTRKGLT